MLFKFFIRQILHHVSCKEDFRCLDIHSHGGSLTFLASPFKTGKTSEYGIQKTVQICTIATLAEIPKSFSVLTLPYKTQTGMAFGIDFFVESQKDFKIHMQVCVIYKYKEKKFSIAP